MTGALKVVVGTNNLDGPSSPVHLILKVFTEGVRPPWRTCCRGSANAFWRPTKANMQGKVICTDCIAFLAGGNFDWAIWEPTKKV